MRWVLILLVVGVAGVGAAVAAWWPLTGDVTAGQQVKATVTNPVACGAPDARDGVSVPVDGKPRPAKLDGCGHRKDETLDVLLPADTGGDLVVRTPDTAPRGVSLHTRMTGLLVALSAVAGAGFALVLGRTRTPTRTPPKAAPEPVPAPPVVVPQVVTVGIAQAGAGQTSGALSPVGLLEPPAQNPPNLPATPADPAAEPAPELPPGALFTPREDDQPKD